MHRWFVPLLLTACMGGGTPETPKPEPKEEPTPDVPVIDKDELKKSAENVALVPSPVETQRALESSGIDTQLATLIPKHEFDMSVKDVEHAAVRTGVVLADMLLTVKNASKEELVERLEGVRTGMKHLNGGDDIDRTLVDYQESVKAEAINRDELLKDFDELSGAIIPELEFNNNDRVVPLIQAGSWLEGAHLVAKAVKAKGQPSAADGLLKQPNVVAYFAKYVHDEGSKSAPPQVAKRLEESLNTLKGLAEKKEPLNEADIDTVIEATSNVLALL